MPIEAVQIDLLEALGVEATDPTGKPKPTTAAPSASRSPRPTPGQAGTGFDLEAYIERYKLDVSGPEPYEDGQIWIFNVCPWRPSDSKSAFLIKLAGGGISAGCQHATCPGSRSTGNHWKDLRVLIEGTTPPPQSGHSSAKVTESETPAPLAMLDSSEWGIRPAPKIRWLVDKLVAAGETGILAGRSNAGKGLLSIQIAVAVATGRPLWNRSGDGIPRVVLLVQMEDSAEELERRFSRYLEFMKNDPDWCDQDELALRKNLKFLVPDYRAASGLTLPLIVPFIDKVVTGARADGAPVGLIILDTLAALSLGDENSVESQRGFWPACYSLRDSTGAHVMVVHHTRKLMGSVKGVGIDERMSFDALRGSTAIVAGARTVLQMEPLTPAEAGRLGLNEEKAQQGGYVALTLTKVVSGPKGECLILEQNDGLGGGFWTLHPQSDELAAQLKSKAAADNLGKAEVVLLSIADKITDRNKLIELHWPGVDAKKGKDCLKSVLSHLRHRYGWLQGPGDLRLTIQGQQKVEQLRARNRSEQGDQSGNQIDLNAKENE